MSRKKILKLRLGGVGHTLRYAQLKNNHGELDHDTREIRVARNEDPYEELETVVHELLHGLGPHWREWWVDRSAKELSMVLWRLGYRKTDDAEV